MTEAERVPGWAFHVSYGQYVPCSAQALGLRQILVMKLFICLHEGLGVDVWMGGEWCRD